MAFTSADLTAIETAIKSGTLRVRDSSGNEVWYQSINELQAVRRQILDEIAAATPTPAPRPRHQLADFSDA